MQFENSHELPINDSLQDDMLYRIIRSDPWYANIVNFMVTRYVPPGADKRKLIYESCHHIWDEPYLFRVYSNGLFSEGVYRLKKESRLLKDVTHHHMEVIMGHSVLMQKSSKVDFSGQLCMKTQRILFEGVEHIRGTGTSIQ
jgi:hypothetical protein